MTGTLLWDDYSHGSVSTDAHGVELGTNLFVLGYAADGGSKEDFVIRAYGIRDDLTAPRLKRISR